MKVNSVELSISAVRRSQYPVDKKPEILIVGKSNVGKSSFINTIMCRKNFARTSATPGKTQTLNFYLLNNEFYFVDVPGYGFAKVDKNLKQKFGLMMEEYLEERNNLKKVFMIIDIRHKPSNEDIMMYEYLKHYNIPMTIIATKSDKLSNNQIEKSKKIIIQTLKIESDESLILFSALTKKGRDEVYIIMDKILE